MALDLPTEEFFGATAKLMVTELAKAGEPGVVSFNAFVKRIPMHLNKLLAFSSPGSREGTKRIFRFHASDIALANELSISSTRRGFMAGTHPDIRKRSPTEYTNCKANYTGTLKVNLYSKEVPVKVRLPDELETPIGTNGWQLEAHGLAMCHVPIPTGSDWCSAWR